MHERGQAGSRLCYGHRKKSRTQDPSGMSDVTRTIMYAQAEPTVDMKKRDIYKLCSLQNMMEGRLLKTWQNLSWLPTMPRPINFCGLPSKPGGFSPDKPTLLRASCSWLCPSTVQPIQPEVSSPSPSEAAGTSRGTWAGLVVCNSLMAPYAVARTTL